MTSPTSREEAIEAAARALDEVQFAARKYEMSGRAGDEEQLLYKRTKLMSLFEDALPADAEPLYAAPQAPRELLPNELSEIARSIRSLLSRDEDAEFMSGWLEYLVEDIEGDAMPQAQSDALWALKELVAMLDSKPPVWSSADLASMAVRDAHLSKWDAAWAEARRVIAASEAPQATESKDAEVLRLAYLLCEAADEIEKWGAFANEYFQEKHRLKEIVAHYRKIADAAI